MINLDLIVPKLLLWKLEEKQVIPLWCERSDTPARKTAGKQTADDCSLELTLENGSTYVHRTENFSLFIAR